MDKEPHYTIQQYPNVSKSAVIDHAPWSSHQEVIIKHALLDQQILNIQSDSLFIDVGANIGQMTLTGLIRNIHTMAFDPLEYDITKICSGVKETMERGLISPTSMEKLHLYRAVVGNESRGNVSITRPDDGFGKFEQASLFKDTIGEFLYMDVYYALIHSVQLTKNPIILAGVARKPQTLVEEVVPMVKLDDIVPTNLPVGLVKIDVQGFEWPVVQGMKGLLERTSGYPNIVHYEEQERITTLAGFQLGTVQTFLEGYGYICTRLGSDINCVKQ